MKPVQALVIQPDSTMAVVEMRELGDYKAALNGGWLEPVPLQGGVMYVDEEFLLRGYTQSDVNGVATAIVQAISPVGVEFILGPAIIVGPTNDEGDDTDVPQELVVVAQKVALSLRETSS